MSINDLIDQRRIKEVYILARYFYRYGEPFLSDRNYDILEQMIKNQYYEECKEYLNRTYDDDPVPFDLLELIGVRPIIVNKPFNKELYDYLNEDKSFSIQSVHGRLEAWDFFKFLKENKLDFVASLKMDGVNTKMLYVDGEFAISLSRGRNAADSFDYTENSAKVMPFKFETGNSVQKITGESYVLEEALPFLRIKYGKPDGYVTSKSAAISMLRVAHDREDYKWLKTRVFSIDGYADTHEQMFKKAEAAGMMTPPWMKVNWQEIPDDYDSFCIWVKNRIMDPIWKEGEGLPSDGVVIEVNDYSWTGIEKNQYVNRQLALKFDYWGNKYYKGIVKDIHIEQQRVLKSIRIEIEPIKTHDGAKATFINSFNPDILFQADARVGNTVYFERNSNAINVLLYGDKLKNLLDKG